MSVLILLFYGFDYHTKLCKPNDTQAPRIGQISAFSYCVRELRYKFLTACVFMTTKIILHSYLKKMLDMFREWINYGRIWKRSIYRPHDLSES